MTVANPCKYFINGRDIDEFTYIPGSKVFQVNISGHHIIHFNAIVFANSSKHATKILCEWVDFRLKQLVKFEKYAKKYSLNNRRNKEKVLICNSILAAIANPDKTSNGITVKIEPAPKNQFYKTSWASNDTLL